MKNSPIASSGRSRTRFHALLVAGGILLSRIFGVIRDSVFAYFFGNTPAADAYRAAFRIPNFLQNLFGEGALSASFIPVYARLIAEGDEKEAGRVAGAIGALLALLVSSIVTAGIFTAPYLVYAIAPGFTGEKREFTITLVKILFPGAGLLVYSAWCLGILNSHRKFFLSYTAPVMWNIAIIAALLAFGSNGVEEYRLAEIVCWGSVAGSGLQVAIQLPMVFRLAKGLRFSFDRRNRHVRTIIKNFIPAFISRGVVQISAFIDNILATLLPSGALSAFTYAQTLYTLPVSLFGMSVSAAELPEMSSALGSDIEIAGKLRERLNGGLRQISFFIIPSAMAFFALGDVIAAAIYQHGKFTRNDSVYVWGILAGSAIGLLASTLSRLYSSTYYALRDTRTPFRYAVIRVSLAMGLAYGASLYLPSLFGIHPRWGAAGISAASGFCGWIEFVLLRSGLNKRIGETGVPLFFILRLWGAAAAGAAAGWGIKLLVGGWNPIIQAVVILGPYGMCYFAVCYILGIPEVMFLRRIVGIVKRYISAKSL